METERRSDTAAGEIHAGMGDFHVSRAVVIVISITFESTFGY